VENRKKLKTKKGECSEVTVIRGVSPVEEKEGCGKKDLQKWNVLSLE